MKALISPNETTTAGARVVDLQVTSYPVAPPLFWLDCDNTVTINHFWSVNSGFVLPEPEAQPDIIATQVTSISRRQFFRALHSLELLQSVLDIVKTSDEITQLDFENATTFEREDPVLISMAYALGKTDNDIDALFTLAATY